MNLEFDRKMGPEFIRSVPDASGIYVFRDKAGAAIYVGKAKSLKRRLSQYRLASQRKAFRKMRAIVKVAATLEYRTCASEKDALLLENAFILAHRPRLNVAGAFSFLYPYIGISCDSAKPGDIHLCLSTSPEILAGHGFALYGAFRSRLVVKEAFEALAYLLPFVGHPTPAARKRYGNITYTRIICFRQMEQGWREDFDRFFRGESSACLDRLLGELLEKPDARRLAGEIQAHIRNLKFFFSSEASKLRSTLDRHGIAESMIPQAERDRLFLLLG